MLSVLYNIIIGPIELILETAYGFLLLVVRNNQGFAVLGISIIVSVLCLPLYAKAESLQEKERLIQKKMAKKVASIRKNFKGDERYMILSMYYRENHYHPIMAMRSSFSLLVQVPFFIAAYHFLSHLESIKGESFLFIENLGIPDGLLNTGLFKINILPILMTGINIVSGIIYTRGFPLKDKLQLNALAVFFLILLYNSPSALVIYWTSNNIFSLAKNIVYRFKNRMQIFYCIVLGGLVSACLYVIFFRSGGRSQRLLFSAASALFTVLIALIPLYVKVINRIGKKWFQPLREKTREVRLLFIISSILAGILCGIFIPFNVVASDPAEFSYITGNSSPFYVLLPPLFISLGIFIFWPIYVFFIGNTKLKILFCFLMTYTALTGILNTFIFSGNYGMLSQQLQFPGGTVFSGTALFLFGNIISLALLLFIILLFFRYGKIKPLYICCIILLVSLSGFSVLKTRDIQKGYTSFEQIVKSNKENTASTGVIQPVINLSRTEKNVFIIMLDKAFGAYFPELLQEKNSLASAFRGFVYYPNTVSFFRSTILGAPPLFGGYEYTPEKMQERNTDPMVTKHNESYLLLPVLFQQNDYSIAVFDLPYFNYQSRMDIKFFADKNMRAGNLDGKYNNIFLSELEDNAPADREKPDVLLRHNFTVFSLFTIAPVLLREIIYDGGNYWSAVNSSRLDIVTGSALRSYAVLHYLPQLTGLNETRQTFTMLVSNMAHDPSFLQYPDYSVNSEISDFGPDRFNGNINSFQYYHVNAASYLLLGKWFEWLKDQGVYDNTRIIIVSDHAESLIVPENTLDRKYTSYNPILLFKDFDADFPVKTDMTFMTNADVPLLAVKDLFPDARNPFTGKVLRAEKENGVNVFLGGSSQPQDYPGNDALDKVSSFYHIKDNIFEEKNWTKITKKYDL
jgi:YidC/Oxa1 family membrane protein insertase